MTSKTRGDLLALIKTMKYQKINEVYYPKWFYTEDMRKQIEEIKKVEIFDGDVITLGYIRSGNHWAFEVVNMILRQSTEHRKEKVTDVLLEHRGATIHETLANEKSPRQLLTHFRPRCLPTQIFEKKVKIVYILRNPKDVIASAFRLYKTPSPGFSEFTFHGHFNDFLELYLSGDLAYGDWCDHVLAIEQFMKDHPQIPVHIHCYEHMRENPESTVEKLASFLGFPDTLIKAIVENTKVEAMKKLDKFTSGKESTAMLGKGQIGSWKEMFHVSLNERFNEIFNRKMEGSVLAEIVRPYI